MRLLLCMALLRACMRWSDVSQQDSPLMTLRHKYISHRKLGGYQ